MNVNIKIKPSLFNFIIRTLNTVNDMYSSSAFKTFERTVHVQNVVMSDYRCKR